jgi:hypothetical protein
MAKLSALSEIEPYAVGTREAGRRGGHGKTKTFALIKAGEYQSYLDGRVRMVVTASIRDRIQRKLEESGKTTKDTRPLTEASKRARVQRELEESRRTEDQP